MTTQPHRSWFGLTVLLVIAATSAVFYATRERWLPLLTSASTAGENSHPGSHSDESHAGHAHGHEGKKGLSLTDRARQNLGLKMGKVELQEWWQSVSIPAEVMEEPGHSEQAVSSAVQGIVLRIHAFPGQTVRAGDPIVDIQPTSELLATAESSLLKTLQEIELVDLQIQRMTPTVESGATPVIRKIEKEYERTRLESQRLAQTQELLVRGLSPAHIEVIVKTKTLIRQITVRVPAGVLPGDEGLPPIKLTGDRVLDNEPDPIPQIAPGKHEHGSVYSVEALSTQLGQLVQPGSELCRLARHSHLYIAGRAFERESHLVARALANDWPVKAVFESADNVPLVRDGLSILYCDNVIDVDSNTLRFYVPLTNEIVRDSTGSNGQTYRAWRFKPGQKAQLLVPTNHLTKRIVLPAEAVVKEGAEAYVFRMNGKLLERVAVCVEAFDSREAVLANDGALFAGDVVALNQAYQLNLAMKKSQGDGGGGHSHDGHNH
jgi:cobalt-zinc-cadmium efflux system membrane fusion protein